MKSGRACNVLKRISSSAIFDFKCVESSSLIGVPFELGVRTKMRKKKQQQIFKSKRKIQKINK